MQEGALPHTDRLPNMWSPHTRMHCCKSAAAGDPGRQGTLSLSGPATLNIWTKIGLARPRPCFPAKLWMFLSDMSVKSELACALRACLNTGSHDVLVVLQYHMLPCKIPERAPTLTGSKWWSVQDKKLDTRDKCYQNVQNQDDYLH
jgi:hypothetical protein